MQKYIQIAFESRGLDIYGNSPICELCKKKGSQDVDHIEGRGGKRNIDNRLLDPFNMIFLCRDCHQKKRGFDWKMEAKRIAKENIIFPCKKQKD